jgi:hypothetical protein
MRLSRKRMGGGILRRHHTPVVLANAWPLKSAKLFPMSFQSHHHKSVVTPDAEALSDLFGRKNKKRTEQIEEILETLKGLGQL